MSERQVVLDENVQESSSGSPANTVDQREALRAATQRAERAEAELARLKQSADPDVSRGQSAADNAAPHGEPVSGVAALRQDAMMAHLLDALDAGKDIGHYGRLVFAMVARHFLSHEELLAELTKDRDFSEAQARVMIEQVKERDYSPPRRERIVEWQAQQDFSILPSPHDPDCGNVYRALHFPDKTYQHIEGYREERLQDDAAG